MISVIYYPVQILHHGNNPLADRKYEDMGWRSYRKNRKEQVQS